MECRSPVSNDSNGDFNADFNANYLSSEFKSECTRNTLNNEAADLKEGALF